MAKTKSHTDSSSLVPGSVTAPGNITVHGVTAKEPVVETKESTCKNCKFYLDSPELVLGQCRRYPPSVPDTVRLTKLGPLSLFPIVLPSMSCGEFQPSAQ